MKCLALMILMTLSSVFAHASVSVIDTICKGKAEKALAKVAQALGLGQERHGLAGGCRRIKTERDDNGNYFVTYGDSLLSTQDVDGSFSGTGAEVEMIVTQKTECEVNSVKVATGAELRAAGK